jgi:hypothetical protein
MSYRVNATAAGSANPTATTTTTTTTTTNGGGGGGGGGGVGGIAYINDAERFCVRYKGAAPIYEAAYTGARADNHEFTTCLFPSGCVLQACVAGVCCRRMLFVLVFVFVFVFVFFSVTSFLLCWVNMHITLTLP